MILIVVESPAKINKIASFLSRDYIVEASMGHVRDLHAIKMSIDFDDNYEPIYVVTKPEVVTKLRAAMRKCDELYLASDLDYEGTAIAKSLLDLLKPKRYRRLIFNSITREAILAAIKTAGPINLDEVNAQKARRVIDRLFGWIVSKKLTKGLGGKLTAGRVQSPTNRLVVEREREIEAFFQKNSDATYYRVRGVFDKWRAQLYQPLKSGAEIASIALDAGPDPDAKVISFLKACLKSKFRIESVTSRDATRNPSAPFTTSTLQQEANRKMGLPIDATMRLAQTLYESGHITYMRTDSTAISPEGQQGIRDVILHLYGKEYYRKTTYETRASSQEAHECIRPTHPELTTLDKMDDRHQRLYTLIWQRAIASQMAPAQLKITTIRITISRLINEYWFQCQIERVEFAGFMRVYTESQDEEPDTETVKNYSGPLPKVGDQVQMQNIIARQEYAKPPSRYTEASLVKKMEAIGIGRPSTYANTIHTIVDRAYVKIADIPGLEREINIYEIHSERGQHVMKVFASTEKIHIGRENRKLTATELGMKVNDYLVTNYHDMMAYQFTANMENDLDAIATGKKVWHRVVDNFYQALVEANEKVDSQTSDMEVYLGEDESGAKIYTAVRYGPVVIRKAGQDIVNTVKIPDKLSAKDLTLEQALKLLQFPIKIGSYENQELVVKMGPYGAYFVFANRNYNLDWDIAMQKSTNKMLSAAIEIIREKQREILAEFEIKLSGETTRVILRTGPYGKYLQVLGKKTRRNVALPADVDPDKLDVETVLRIVTTKKRVKKSAKNSAKIRGQSRRKSNSKVTTMAKTRTKK